MAGKEFLGKGMKFPPQIDPATGRFEMAGYEDSVRQSIYLILMTQRSERIARPNFGSNIQSYTFMDVNATMLTLMNRELSMAILENEPRVSDVKISTEPQLQAGRLIINVVYTVAGSNSRQNLVFPFYLQQGDDTDKNELREFDNETFIEDEIYSDEAETEE